MSRQLAAFLIISAWILAPVPRVEAADEAVCYAAADGFPDHLVSSWRTGGGFVDIGTFGVTNIEAIAFNLDDSILYAANGGTLGSVNIATGAFTAIGAAGAGDGAVGNINMTDLDGLAFDPVTGILFGTHRRGAPDDDLLIQINPATGALVQDAFGPGVDYVVILGSPVTGFDDIDDITVDPTDGQMYGISNDGGTGDHLVKIDKTDGSVIDVGAFLGTDDMEGLSVSPDGKIFGTTGNGGGNSLWDIDKLTGFATFVFAYPPGSTDMEGVACLRSNVITGTVFVDTNSNGMLDGGELGLAGVTVRLYRDNNNDGAVDGGDTLLQTTVSPADGFYEFFITAIGNFVIDIDTSTLPSGWSLTTDNVEEADFPNFGNVETGNDFGAIGSAGEISLTKVASTSSACPGDTVTYTLTVTNGSGSTTHTGITVGDVLPTGATYVDESTSVTGVAPLSTFRVTEYFVDVGDFGGTGHNVTLDQDLEQNYFVIIQGSDGNGASNSDRGPDENYARLTDDPFGTGDLGTTGATDEIRIERDNSDDSWVGVVTVVECLANCSTAGFTLNHIEYVTAASGSSSGSEPSAGGWTDLDQVMLMGGFNGAGCETPESDDTEAPVCHKRIWPSGANTINWSRDNSNDSATSTVMVVEWGSEWTVQRVRVQDTNANSGDGVDATNEYTTGSVSSVVRANTWVWGTGFTDDNGPGDSAEGVVITLGNGVTQNANETTVAVGLEYSQDIDFEVYTLTHSSLAVDYRFKSDGDSGTLGVNLAVDTAGSERMALSYNGADDTGDNYPRSMFSARYLTDSSVRLERRRSGTEFPAWVQGIDFTGIGSGTVSVTKDNAPGGLNPDLVDGAPPNLVTAADLFQIPAGESMTVTFQATIDNPYNGASPLINAASGRSAEGGFGVDTASTTVTLATIGNLVWYDLSQDGTQDPGELGIADVPITVYGPGPDGNLGTGDDVYVSSTFTDANGNFSFPNLGPGDYRVDVNETWLSANGYTEQIYPALPHGSFWDLRTSGDWPALTCGGSEDRADFGYWDLNPVPVTLSSFAASEGRGGTFFEWTTATQVGTVGFNLYAVSGSGWRRINPELIPAHAPDSVVPQHYEYEAAAVDAEAFAIEDVDIRGHRKRHGPFAKALRHGLDPMDSPERPVAWSAIRGEHQQKVEARRRSRGRMTGVGFAPTGAAKAGGRRGGDRRQPWGEIVRFLVETDGVYRVSHEVLLQAGIDLSGLEAERLALTAGGWAVPIFVRGGPVFGPGSSIEWVASAFETLYTKTDVYILSLNPRHVSRIGVDWRAPEDGASSPDYYLETTTAERNQKYSFASPNGDPWYDTAILAYTTPKSADFEITIDELVEGADTVTLRVEMWGTTNWPESPDHHVEVGFNGVPVADAIFDGLRNYPLEIELPAGVLEEGANTLELTLPGDTGVAYDLVTFDSFSITYPRRLVARDGRLEFDAAAEVLRVEGLPGPDAVVYRLTGDAVTLIAVTEITPGEDGYVARFRGSSEPARYFVTATPAIATPQLEPARDGSSILKGEADYLMIAHPDFIEGLDPLIAAREIGGWRVKVVDVEDVYAEFSHGIVDPEAIRSYISYAAEHLETEMVLLIGGDTYDYHDYLGLGSLSFIPSLYARTSEIVRFTPADPLFTDFDGDRVPDLPIGRLPVRTSGELEVVIDKTLDYAARSYSRSAVFAADKDEASGESFAATSNAFISQLPAGWWVSTVYLDEHTLDYARVLLLVSLNRGPALTSYFGHSGPTVWSFDNLFHVSDVARLENYRMPTIVTQWGCWNTYYVEPTNNTMGHALLLSGDQGAAAVFGASTLTESASDQALGERFIPLLVEPGKTIGGALQEAKEELAREEPGLLDVLLGWTLLGDPALVVEPQ